MTTLTALLKTVIAVILVGLIALQAVVLPWTASAYASAYPEFAWMRSPLLVLATPDADRQGHPVLLTRSRPVGHR
jgi:hypothetical protein